MAINKKEFEILSFIERNNGEKLSQRKIAAGSGLSLGAVNKLQMCIRDSLWRRRSRCHYRGTEITTKLPFIRGGVFSCLFLFRNDFVPQILNQKICLIGEVYKALAVGEHFVGRIDDGIVFHFVRQSVVDVCQRSGVTDFLDVRHTDLDVYKRQE